MTNVGRRGTSRLHRATDDPRRPSGVTLLARSSPVSDTDFDTTVTVGALLALVALGTVALLGMGVMATSTVLMMVTPAMLVFGAIALLFDVKHGEYRATR